MAESTTTEGTTALTMAPGFISNTTKVADCPTGPMQMDMGLDAPEIATPIILASHPSPIPLKGTKNNIMLGHIPVPHPLSMGMDPTSFHRFHSDNSLYTHTNPAFIHAALGPVPSSSPCYSTSTVPTSTTAAFMAMHGHNTSLYEPPRRNSVPTLTADQAEHKRKTSSEEKTLQRQASWSCFSSPPATLGGFAGLPLSGLHHQTDATHVDPSAMNCFRGQSQHHSGLSSAHSLSQVMPSSTSSSACPSPMPESFMSGSVLSNLNSSSTDDESPASEIGGAKVKRNNSVCSTTSVSSTGSTSGNKHPCRSPGCGWSFKRYEHLKRHMLVHSKERSFVCDFAGCNKSFSRSDNFSAHLRTHSKKGSDHCRRRNSRVPDSGLSSDDAVKQEDLDIHLDSSSPHDQLNSEPSESGRESSPARSPVGTPLKEDETFGMLGNSGYPFGGNTMYPMDPLDPLSSMVPRFDTIRLDLKSVAPGDVHKQPNAHDQHAQVLLSAGNSSESPHPSPIPHYEQFTFPSSISTHFMPMMHGGYPMDPSGLQQQHSQLQQSPMHNSSPSASFSPMPMTDSSSSSSSATLHPGYTMDHDMRGLQFSNVAGLHYAATSPMNEDGPIHAFHPHSPFHAHTSIDLYETKVATPQMLHHSFPPLHSPSPAALPPHPLMSAAAFSASGLSEPLYSSPSPATSGNLTVPRGKESLMNPTPSSVTFSTLSGSPLSLPSSSPSFPHSPPVSASSVPDHVIVQLSTSRPVQAAVKSPIPAPTFERKGDETDTTIQYYPSTILLSPQFSYLATMRATCSSPLPPPPPEGSQQTPVPSPLPSSSSSMPMAATSVFSSFASSSPSSSQPLAVMDNSNMTSAFPSPNVQSLDELVISTPTLASQRHHPLPSMMRVMSTGSSDYSDGSLYGSSPSPYSPRFMDTHCMSSSPSLSSLSLGNAGAATPDSLSLNGASSNSAATASNGNGTTNGANGNASSGGGNSNGNGSKHGGSGKHHTCSVMGCSKRFKRLEHLKRHIKTHTLERPFNCPYTTCTKRFSRSDNLAQHVKTHQRQLNKLQMKHRSQAQAQAQAQAQQAQGQV